MIKSFWGKHKAFRGFSIILLILIILLTSIGVAINISITRSQKDRNIITVDQQKYIEKKKMTNILLIGCDKRDYLINSSAVAGENGQADFICLASIDWENERVYLTSIPRETVTEVHVRDDDGNIISTEEKQICLEYAYGTSPEEGSEYMVDAVSDVLGGTSIDYYCTVSMGILMGLLDDIGGVDVTMSNDCQSNDMYSYKAGETVHMSGEEAYEFVHFRSIYVNFSNLDRMMRQRDFMLAFVPKVKETVKSDYKIIFRWIDKYKNYYCTNIPIYIYPLIGYAAMKYDYNIDNINQISGREEHIGNYDWFYVDDDGVNAMQSVTLYENMGE